jgi:hypothetical protein
MSDRTPVLLKHRPSGNIIPAELIDPISREQAEAANVNWRTTMDEAVRILKARHVSSGQMPQHAHWDWLKKFDAVQGLVSYHMLGIEAKLAMQGMLLLCLDGHFGRLEAHRGKPLVYVHFLSTAPWNSPLVVAEPEFGLVGRILVAAAIQISQAEEFAGRVALHALPQSESWYRHNCGMTDLGPDPADHNSLHYFEMTAQQAAAFLE